MASAQVVFYQALKAKITALVDGNGDPLVKTCMLWNNQLPYNKEEQSFEFPAVFIEYAQLESVTLQAGINMYATLVRFHLGFENYMLEDLTMFDVKDAIDKAICTTLPNNVQVAAGVPGWIPLEKVREQHDSDDSSVYIYIMEYENRLMDLNVSKLAPLIPTTVDLDLEQIPQIVPVIN